MQYELHLTDRRCVVHRVRPFPLVCLGRADTSVVRPSVSVGRTPRSASELSDTHRHRSRDRHDGNTDHESAQTARNGTSRKFPCPAVLGRSLPSGPTIRKGTEKMINVLLVDDHTIFRAGLVRLLEEDRSIDAVMQAADGTTALKLIREHSFSVVLLDINLPVRSGLELLPAIARIAPHLPVIMLSMYSAKQYALRAFESGASGYVSKDMDAEVLIAAIHKVVAGGRYITPEVAEQMLENVDVLQSENRHLTLSEREYSVMMQIANGVSLTAIAQEMHVSIKTVSTYRSRLLKKMGLDGNAALVQYAVRNRLID
ncbi:response regulator transcription factor [Rhodococcus jostii]|uniref:Response regulator transcription factor n=1 Tax=Rhodococcus jostii TaxID=132919 RepID=A0ABU4C793_RHOJO|nr:response regulator transcription factor [Rhodococcus jostii]MDV6279173.1 response regulator transcription factor [Rhodococcus jostii]